MLATWITLPASTTEDLLAFAGGLFTDLWLLIALAIGIPLAFYMISRVIGLVRSRSAK